ncbi:unnamed protein product [Caenorhabditis auriculariae]|uniref:Uncharacterized protein n=1 Tax=Caenorhabditis auriculariae TaxID=2777116 RepID=A0A8S1GUE2_9PELO|nr:unnamed protein product [Caenorhabditis auriculariae]
MQRIMKDDPRRTWAGEHVIEWIVTKPCGSTLKLNLVPRCKSNNIRVDTFITIQVETLASHIKMLIKNRGL